MKTRRRWWIAVGVLCALCMLAAIPAVRTAALESIGRFLLQEDPIEKVDVLVITREPDLAGQLEVADLFHQGVAPAVLSITPRPRPEDLELARRGVPRRDVVVDTLVQLGVPRAAISVIDGGEGGTTNDTLSLADWARRTRPRRVLVVVSPTHGRRFGRVVRRVWPADLQPPVVRTARLNAFRADNWWHTRANARVTIVECQKLLLDYLAHPF